MADDAGLFAPIATGDELLAATSDRAWLQAMLDVEAALAISEADAGIVPTEAAASIAAVCRSGNFDLNALGRSARLSGNPVIPLVAAIREMVSPDARDWIHWGATSQDILDSAAMLVVERSMVIIDRDLDGLASGCAVLAERHRDTLTVGRTLLQHALPMTFGLKAAGWLIATLDARHQLAAARSRLAVQLGGASGTLASLGAQGPEVVARLAQRLGLAEPILPWHTARQRVAELGAALGLVAGTAAKIATDVALLMQTEVGEASEPAMPGRGGSSTLPHKRNPVGAAAIRAAATRAHALMPVLFAGLVAEHERAVGAWQAEWETVSELLRLAGGAVERVRETIAGLHVDTQLMADNLAMTGGLVLAERVALALAGPLGRERAAELVHQAAMRAASTGRPFANALLDEPEIADSLPAADLDALLDPRTYLGSTGVFIDRALAVYREGAQQRWQP